MADLCVPVHPNLDFQRTVGTLPVELGVQHSDRDITKRENTNDEKEVRSPEPAKIALACSESLRLFRDGLHGTFDCAAGDDRASNGAR